MAVPVTIQSLAAQVRLESGLRNNQVLSDTDLYSFINEAFLDLRDRLIVRFAYWFRQEQTFTLTSDVPGNIFDLTTLPDFQMVQGLDLVSSPGIYTTVTMLNSYQERNSMTSTWPFMGQSYGYAGVLGRKYWVDGDNLEVLPAQNAGGTYRLVYTPIQVMQPPITATTATTDVALNVAGKLAFNLANAPYADGYLGGTLTVTWATPNSAWNGTFTIGPSSVGGAIVTTADYVLNAFTPPPVGPISIQPGGTTDTLPAKLVPWSQYIVLYAAIAAKNSRNQDPSALLARFADIKQRVIDLTKQRSEGVRQAPISRARYGGGIIGNGR
jgi:hypothetical protein